MLLRTANTKSILVWKTIKSSTHPLLAKNVTETAVRSLATKSPGANPLEVIRSQCTNRHLCDELGYRRPGVHWVLSLAVTPDDVTLVRRKYVTLDCQDKERVYRPHHFLRFFLPLLLRDYCHTKPPDLRTVGVQRVSNDGIEFVMKKGSGTCDALAGGRPISILHLQGRYMPGETAEQWRGEGFCERMVMSPELLNNLPSYTITSMVASKRLEMEKGDLVEELKDGVSGVGVACALLFV